MSRLGELAAYKTIVAERLIGNPNVCNSSSAQALREKMEIPETVADKR